MKKNRKAQERIFREKSRDLINTLHLSKSILDSLNIPFFLHGGTCLGLVRDGGLIKVDTEEWGLAIDSDIDIGVFGDSVDDAKFNAIVNAFKEHGYELYIRDWTEVDLRYESKTDFLKDLPKKYRRLIHLRKKGCLHVDILFFYKYNNVAWYCWSGPVYIIAAYPLSWFENLAKINVVGKTFYLPHNPERYLEDEYGNGKRVRELTINGRLYVSSMSNWKVKEHNNAVGIQLMRESLWRARRMRLFETLKKKLREKK